jgi:hypothetical protein
LSARHTVLTSQVLTKQKAAGFAGFAIVKLGFGCLVKNFLRVFAGYEDGAAVV